MSDKRPWSEQWAASEGYRRAMESIAKQNQKFWENHRERMADIERQERQLNFRKMKPMHQAGMGAAVLVIILFAVLFLAALVGIGCEVSHSVASVCQ